MIQNHTGIENRKYKIYQVKEALLDPQVWMLCATSFLQCIPGGGLTAVSVPPYEFRNGLPSLM